MAAASGRPEAARFSSLMRRARQGLLPRRPCRVRRSRCASAPTTGRALPAGTRRT